jgi:hypothetical protein
MVNNNFYGGLEISKSLGRVNLDLGYGVKIGSSEFSPLIGLSFNFN